MKRKRHRSEIRSVATEAQAIDALYGLEPAFEPEAEASAMLTPFVRVQCPYCGESFEIAVDLSAGSFRCIEDCQICCQPIELAGDVDETGAPSGLTVARA
jgi:hypothetical protein